MGPEVSHLFSFIFILFLLLPFLAHANYENSSSAFQLISHTNGSKKGEKVKGLQQVKKFLQHFGYLSYFHSENQTHANANANAADDEFDDILESAIKLYQLNFHLNVTGTLDSDTVSMMMKPRCGVPDIITGANRMYFVNKLHYHEPITSLYTTVGGSYYSFFPGEPKWPPSTKYHLTYAFQPGTRQDAFNVMKQAFNKWAHVSKFKFTHTQDFEHADLKISFLSRDHGDGSNFDGPGGILAHSFAPTDGRLHFDADEHWAVGKVVGAFDIGTVGLHEIGHLLGLGHSNVGAAIMWPTIGPDFTKDLNEDDIQGLKALYHF